MKSWTGPAVKLLFFALGSLATIATIAATIRPLGNESDVDYSAVFTSASRLVSGDTVRVSGVVVGQVKKVAITEAGTARVDFSAERTVPVTTTTTAHVRYLNLVGDRYLALEPGSSPGSPQPQGRPIGESRTTPALDLNTLFGGFKPLLTALSPNEVNSFAMDLVRVLQGEGPTIRSLFEHTASLTSDLARRDELISSVIANLDQATSTVADRHEELSDLVRALHDYIGGLSTDREVIGVSLERIDDLTRMTSDLLDDSQPTLDADIKSVHELTSTLTKEQNREAVNHVIEHLPDKLGRLSRSAYNGTFFNYYLCSAPLKLVGTDGLIEPPIAKILNGLELYDTSPRCQR